MPPLNDDVEERDASDTSVSDAQGGPEGPTCVDVSFMLFQGVLALEPFPAALRFTDEPGVSFTCFLVLLKAVQIREKLPRERTRRYGHVIWWLYVYLYEVWMMYVTWIQS